MMKLDYEDKSLRCSIKDKGGEIDVNKATTQDSYTNGGADRVRGRGLHDKLGDRIYRVGECTTRR